ncbi:hypothetical protein A2803_03840 [Candidatus Woesebacteria bacterium RIFCSPHIGHO2_01_FULL_44_21]|uniref:Glycosyltransferase 2-like domain-containing protein n=1 Tax=Candidatus Woesebacteria bacterium RIFCSPHIGHO2_01_FULL_44_21 TaxID=1802503 RepID=A0A1F7YVL4_9BACT|nr:MAG: hypothetical protein A2803_03840 [Candidatus Woesebacteria bacterium RIFCSPHIGHO2_01_FULL_44_21]
MKIWAHTIVKNEERYVWFSIMSVIDNVDKVLVYDTGSRDNTVAIVKEIKKIYPEKIVLKLVGDVNIIEFTQVRQAMLAETKADWFVILDGDEVWWKESIKNLVNLINKTPKLESVVSKYYALAGDIFHFQDEKYGRYQIDDRTGHINIRAMKVSIPGIHFEKPHGQLGVYDEKGVLVQNQDKKFRRHTDGVSYLHFTNLKRSAVDSLVPKRSFKFKYILGAPFPDDFYYPEVFFVGRPSSVMSPWEKRKASYELRARAEYPLRELKSKLPIFNKTGY